MRLLTTIKALIRSVYQEFESSSLPCSTVGEENAVSKAQEKVDKKDDKASQRLPQKKSPTWWAIKDAEYYRGLCWIYGAAVFRTPLSLSSCFRDALKDIYRNVSGFKFRRFYDEIGVQFVSVNVSGLRPECNSRDINLKQLILDSLREALVRYAVPQIDLSPWLEYVVTDVWLQNGLLVMEIPWSGFYYQYYTRATVLMSEDYKKFKRILRFVDQL